MSANVIKSRIPANSTKNFPSAIIASDLASAHITIHPRFPTLVQNFLAHKRSHGSRTEQQFYRSITWREQVSRLVDKRAIVFMTSRDSTVLRDGRDMRDGREAWDRVGTDNEDARLKLEEYLSYDEILLGSLLGVSSNSFFINEGGRYNRMRPGEKGTFEERGVIVGLVGARFEREGRMDGIYCLPRCEETRQHEDLTGKFLDFFGCQRQVAGAGGDDFDEEVYMARIRITAELLLLEANARAEEDEEGRTAYVYIVGLGLGVWQYNNQQKDLYIRAFHEAISGLTLPRVSTLDFAWIDGVSADVQRDVTQMAEKKGIKVVFTRRDPATKLQGEDAGKLLVLSYAWDGNAFPGNEYWVGSLSGSGDPAAACMSTITEVHNPTVNVGFTQRIVVAGEQS